MQVAGVLRLLGGCSTGCPCANVVVWSAMIFRHVDSGQQHEAFSFSPQMQYEGVVKLNAVSFVIMLKASTRRRAVHSLIQWAK